MLNLYLAPKSTKADPPTPDAIENALEFMRKQGVVGASFGPGEYAPGDNAATLFHPDADQHLLPVELTYEALYVHRSSRPEFLPRDQDPAEFDRAECSVCEEPVHGVTFEECFDKLDFFPVNRVEYECPCCLSTYPFADLNFGQPTVVASFWLQIEGAAFSRLNTNFLEHLSKLLGLTLIVVPEVVDDQARDFAEVRQMRFR